MARDDPGAGALILSAMMYNVLGAPRTEEALGQGFGYRIPHRVLHPEAKALCKFFYKIIGVEMEWKEIVPVFFQDNPDAEHNDLALMCSFGWKPQAALRRTEWVLCIRDINGM